MTAARSAGPPWPFLAALGLVAFPLNWVWEMLQMPAYREMAGRSWAETVGTCTLAALGDIAVTFAALGLAVLVAGRLRWGEGGGWNVYAAAALTGVLFATVIESGALSAGRWSYTDRMPVVPVLGVGLWPVLQLALLVPASVRAARWLARRHGISSREGDT